MKKPVNAFHRSLLLIVSLISVVFFFGARTVQASDLITKEIIIPAAVVSCLPFKPQFIICNINIYDAQANEWSVSVTIEDGNKNIIFQETVPGVFLGAGSAANPTCVTLQTEGEFIPEEEGEYSIAVDVDYIYDINPDNDLLTRVFTVESCLGGIDGQKFEDFNWNGQKDAGEFGLDGVTITLYSQGTLIDSQKTVSIDLDGDGTIDPEFESGLFSFDSLPAGNYTVKEITPDGWTQTYPTQPDYHAIQLEAGQIIERILFGNNALSWDFGDLPEPLDTNLLCFPIPCYPTLLSSGARHVAVGPMLGDLRDSETDGLPTFVADGDDTTGVDDEDGVKFVKFTNGGTGNVEVKVSGNPKDFPCFLSGWLDFNADGMLDPKTELIVSSLIPNAGDYTFSFSVPNSIPGGGYARFRVTSFNLFPLLPYGPAIDGEVEDYVAFGIDFGDANEELNPDDPLTPYGYPVKVIHNGARHVIVPTIRLGDEELDGEVNGEPSYLANGDDNLDKEDEYGIEYGPEFEIAFQGPDPDNPLRTLTIYGMYPGSSVTIKPLATSAGLFNMWIDWNRDGDWDDENEQTFDDEPVTTGPSYTTLTFNVPENASLGYTYARYRFSTQTGLEYYGGAPDGEVEDHLLMIDTSFVSDINDGTGIRPESFCLYQNYPNPFNPSTSIKFDVKEETNVLLSVYNVLGQKIAVLINELKRPGTYHAVFKASGLTSGVYFYRIEMGDYSKTMKMLLIR